MVFTFDPQAWSEEQFGGCRLGDKRRTSRLVRLAAQVVSHPSGGLPEQTGTWADLKAAYRLFDRSEVTFDAVAKVHWEQTCRRPPGRYLVLADTFYPGWQARIDGERAAILRANYAFRAVALDAGEHEVVFRYRPLSFIVGVACSGISLVGVFVVLGRSPGSLPASRAHVAGKRGEH